MQLRQWTVTDPQGYDTTVAVYNLDTRTQPDPNMFRIDYAADSVSRRDATVATTAAFFTLFFARCRHSHRCHRRAWPGVR